MRIGRIFGVVFSLSLMVGSLLLYTNRQDVIDWWRLRDYQPAPAIARLATDTSLSDIGRRLFYVHYPELLNKDDFQGKCSNSEETIVLGCYITHSKIFLFNVDDERLNGVEEVTAAHETLHAGYDRLSQDEKDNVDELSKQVFENLDNERIKQNIENYRKRDPSIVSNELHSILGTEVRELPDELEDYYSRYFLNRQEVVNKAETYEKEFASREEQIKIYDERLAVLDTQIRQGQENLDIARGELDSELRDLESKRGDPDSYNAAVPGYNTSVRNFNTQLNSLRALIDEFNEIVGLRNAIAVEERELVEAIDSRLQEQP